VSLPTKRCSGVWGQAESRPPKMSLKMSIPAFEGPASTASCPIQPPRTWAIRRKRPMTATTTSSDSAGQSVLISCSTFCVRRPWRLCHEFELPVMMLSIIIVHFPGRWSTQSQQRIEAQLSCARSRHFNFCMVSHVCGRRLVVGHSTLSSARGRTCIPKPPPCPPFGLHLGGWAASGPWRKGVAVVGEM